MDVAALFIGPPVIGFAMDGLFGTWVRWWRWWFSPFLVGLAGFGYTIWLTVPLPEYNDHGGNLYVFAFFFVVVLPVVTATSAVGLRRLLWLLWQGDPPDRG